MSRFRIESLEPRILLSADLGAAPDPFPAPDSHSEDISTGVIDIPADVHVGHGAEGMLENANSSPFDVGSMPGFAAASPFDGINPDSLPPASSEACPVDGNEHEIDGAAAGLIDRNVRISALSSSNPTLEVLQMRLNGGQQSQRSQIRSIEFEFSDSFELDLGVEPRAILRLHNLNSGTDIPWSATSVESDPDNRILRWTFPGLPHGALPDGNYTVRLNADSIRNGPGPGPDNALDGDGDGQPGGHYFDEFFTFRGDADGDRDFDGADFNRLEQTFRRIDLDLGFDEAFDIDGDGDVDIVDALQLEANLGKRLSPFPVGVRSPEGTWLGGSAAGASAWNDADNWAQGRVPGPESEVQITASTINTPVFAGAVQLKSLSIEAGASARVTGALRLGERLQISGQISIDNGEVEATGNVEILEGGVLGGTGLISGSVRNFGTLRPGNSPGQLVIDGDLVLEAGGTIEFEIANADVLAHDHLIVNGIVILQGGARIFTSGAPPPVLVDPLELMTFSAMVGDFDSIVLPSLPIDRNASVSFGPSSMTFHVAAESDETVVERLTETIQGGMETIAGTINSGSSALASQFNFTDGPGAGFVSAGLGSVLGVANPNGALANLFRTFGGTPTADDTATLVAWLEGQGWEVIEIRGGADAVPDTSNPDDFILIRRAVASNTLSGSAALDLGSWLDHLTQLHPETTATPTVDWTGGFTGQLIVGVDVNGFYLSTDSVVELSVQGDGAVASSANAFGVWSIEGSGTVAIRDTILRATPEQAAGGRLRVAPGQTTEIGWSTTFASDATVTLTQTLQPIALGWTGQWQASLRDGTATASATVDLPSAQDFQNAALNHIRSELALILGDNLIERMQSVPLPLTTGVPSLTDPDFDPANPSGFSALMARILDRFDAAVGLEIETAPDPTALHGVLTGAPSTGTDLLGVRLTGPAAPSDPAAEGGFDWNLDSIGALQGIDLNGRFDAALQAQIDLGLGIDIDGFYLTPDSELAFVLNGTGVGTGQFGPFTARLVGESGMTLSVDLSAGAAVAGSRVRRGDVETRWAQVRPNVESIHGSLQTDLILPLLDYVDADLNPLNDTEHGGDPFRFTAVIQLETEPDPAGGLRPVWESFELLNPDVVANPGPDGQERDDFTAPVLAENMRRLAADMARGKRTEWLGGLSDAFADLTIPGGDTRAAGLLNVASGFAAALIDQVEILHVVDFDTIESWLNTGIPAEPEELLRARLVLDDVSLPAFASPGFALANPFGDATVQAGVENAVLTGELVFGFDTHSLPLYLLTGPDAIRPDAVTAFGGSIDLVATVTDLDLGGGLLVIDEAEIRITPNLQVHFDSGEETGGAKIRFGDLSGAGLEAIRISAGEQQTVRVLARNASLFGSDPDAVFVGRADYLFGEVDFASGALDLAALRASLAFGDTVAISAGNVRFTLDPSVAGTSAAFVLNDAAVSFPAYPDLPTGSVDQVVVQAQPASQTFELHIDDLVIRPGTGSGPETAAAVAAKLDTVPGSHASSGLPIQPLDNGTDSGLARPVIFIPDLAESFPAQIQEPGVLNLWLTTLGLNPSWFPTSNDQESTFVTGALLDPIATAENLDLDRGEDYFVAHYDWRLPIAPEFDGLEDGLLEAVTLETLQDDSYDSAVDYLAYWLDQALASIPDGLPVPQVDIVAHGMGGLVARAYAQSRAYQEAFAMAAETGDAPLPLIANLYLIGTPNLGQTDAWNFFTDNWDRNLTYTRSILPFVDLAYDLANNGETIASPQTSFGKNSLPTSTENGQEIIDRVEFIRHYLPVLNDLLPTYEFLQDEANLVDWLDIVSPTGDREDPLPTFKWDLNGVEVETIRIYLSALPAGRGLFPDDRPGNEADRLAPDADIHPNRILTLELAPGDTAFDASEFTLDTARKLTRSQTYHFGIEAVPKVSVENAFRTPLRATASFTTAPAQADPNLFSAVTLITHGFQIPYWDRDVPADFVDLAHTVARSGGGAVYTYQPDTGAWLFTPDPTGPPLAVPPPPASMLGKPLVLVSDWVTDSAISDSGFSEAAADALFASLIQLDRQLGGKVFASPMHLIGFSRGTIVTSEIAQRLGVHFPEIGRGGTTDLHVTLLDPHDFAQDSLNVPVGGLSSLLAIPLIPVGGLGLPIYVQLTGNTFVPYDDFKEPRIETWSNISFLDSYWQDRSEESGEDTLPVFGSWTPNGRPIENADLVIELNQRPGFTRDDFLFGIGGPHQRVKSWYAGTTDLSLDGFHEAFVGGTNPIWRLETGELIEAYDYTGDRSLWYAAYENDAADGPILPPDEAPSDGIGAGWFYSVLGGGVEERPSSDMRVPVVTDNTPEFAKGDGPVPSLFNGNFEASIRPNFNRFPIPLQFPWNQFTDEVGEILEEAYDYVLGEVTSFAGELSELVKEALGDFADDIKSLLDALLTDWFVEAFDLDEGTAGDELAGAVANSVSDSIAGDIEDLLQEDREALHSEILEAAEAFLKAVLDLSVETVTTVLGIFEAFAPSWRELPGWSFHGGSGGLTQGNHIVNLIPLSELIPILEDLNITEGVEDVVAWAKDGAADDLNVLIKLLDVLDFIGIGPEKLIEGGAVALLNLVEFGALNRTIELGTGAIDVAKILDLDPSWELPIQFSLDQLTHNRSYIAPEAGALSFRTRAYRLEGNAVLKVRFLLDQPDGADPTVIQVGAISVTEESNYFSEHTLAVPPQVRGQIARLEFLLESVDDETRVWVDDIEFVEEDVLFTDTSGNLFDRVLFFLTGDGQADPDSVDSGPIVLTEFFSNEFPAATLNGLMPPDTGFGPPSANAAPLTPPASTFSHDIIVKTDTDSAPVTIKEIRYDANEWLGFRMDGSNAVTSLKHADPGAQTLPLNIQVAPGQSHALRFVPNLEPTYVPNLDVEGVIFRTTIEVVTERASDQGGDPVEKVAFYELYYILDSADDDPDDLTIHLANTLSNQSRSIRIRDRANIDLSLINPASTAFSVNRLQPNLIEITFNAPTVGSEQVFNALFDIKFNGKSVLPVESKLPEFKARATPTRRIDIPLPDVEALINGLLTCKPHFTAGGDPTQCPVDPLASAGAYDNFYAIPELADDTFSPADRAALRQGILSAMEQIYETAFTQRNTQSWSSDLFTIAFNQAANIYPPFPTSSDVIVTTIKDWNDSGPPPNQVATRDSTAWAQQYFAFTNFRELLLPENGTPRWTTLSTSSIRYILDQITGYNYGGIPFMHLFFDSIARKLRPGTTMEALGRNLGFTFGHEYAHNLGLFDDYLVAGKTAPPGITPPVDGNQTFMSTHGNLDVDDKQLRTIALALDHPQLQDELLGWSDPSAARATLFLWMDWFDRLIRLNAANGTAVGTKVTDGLARPAPPSGGATTTVQGDPSSDQHPNDPASQSPAATRQNHDGTLSEAVSRNNFLHDLNAVPLGDIASRFAFNVEVFVSTSALLQTPTTAASRVGSDPNDLRVAGLTAPSEDRLLFNSGAEFNNGNGTVTIESQAGPFAGDDGIKLTWIGAGSSSVATAANPGSANTGVGASADADLSHSALPGHPELQRRLFESLGLTVPQSAIVTGSARTDRAHVLVVQHRGVDGAVSPADDERRFGFENGEVVNDFEDAVWLGGQTGVGFLFDPVQGEIEHRVAGEGGSFGGHALAMGPSQRGGKAFEPGTLPAGETRTNTFSLFDLFDGFGLEDLIELQDPLLRINLDLRVTPETFTIDATVGVEAAAIALFPDRTTPAVDGVAFATVVAGSISLDGALSLSAGTVHLDFGDALVVSATGQGDDPGLQIDWDPNRPELPLATVRNLTVDVPAIEAWPTALTSLTEVIIERDRIAATKTFGSPTTALSLGTNPELVRFDGFKATIQLDLGFDLDPAAGLRSPTFSGGVTIESASGAVLPDDTTDGNGGLLTVTGETLPDDTVAPGLAAQLDLATGRIDVSLHKLTGRLEGLIELEAEDTQLMFDPAAFLDPVLAATTNLVTVSGLEARIPALSADGETATVTFQADGGLGVRHDGSLFLGDGVGPLTLDVTLPAGLADRFGLGFLPVIIDGFQIVFPNSGNLDSVIGTVQGHFALDAVAEALGVTPFVHIGDPAEFDPDSTANISPQNQADHPFELGLIIDSLGEGRFRPADFGPVTLGFRGLDVAGVVVDGQVSLGRIRADGSFTPLSDVDGGANVAGFVDVVSGFDLGGGSGRIDLAGTIDLDPTGNASLVLDGQIAAQVAGVQGSIRFGLEIDAVVLEEAPFLALDIRPTFEDLSITSAVLDLSPVARLTVEGIDIFAEPDPVPELNDTQNASLSNIALELFLFPDWDVTTRIQGARQLNGPDGVAGGVDRLFIESASLSVTGAIGDLLSFVDLTVILEDLDFRFDTGSFELVGIDGGAIRVEADSATLFPGDDDFTASVSALSPAEGGTGGPGFSGSFDLNTGALTLTAARLQVAVGTLVELEARGIDFVFDAASIGPEAAPDAPIARTQSAQIRFPDLIDADGLPFTVNLLPSADLPHAIEIRRDGFAVGRADSVPADVLFEDTLTLEAAQVTVGTFGFSTISGLTLDDVGFSATSAQLFPARAATAAATGVRLNLDIAQQALRLEADTFTAALGDFLELEAHPAADDEPAVTFHLAADQAPDAPLLTVANATLAAPFFQLADGSPLQASVSGFEIRRNGFSLQHGTLGPQNIFIDGIVEVVGLQLDVENFDFTVGRPDPFSVGLLQVSAGTADLLDGLATLEGLTVTLDLNAGSLVVELERLTAALGGLIEIDALATDVGPIALRFDRDPSTDILTLPVLQATFPVLEIDGQSPEITVHGLGIADNGDLRLDSVVLDVEDYVFAIADFIPFAVTAMEYVPGETDDGKVDLDSFELLVTGRFDLDRLEDLLFPDQDTNLIVIIGDDVDGSIYAQDAPSAVDVHFGLAVDSLQEGRFGLIHPVDPALGFGPITLGIENFAVGGVVFDARITLGQFTPTGELVAIPGTEQQVAGFLEVDFEDDRSIVQPLADENLDEFDADADAVEAGVGLDGFRIDFGGNYTPATDTDPARFEVDFAADVGVRLKLGNPDNDFGIELYGVNFAGTFALENPKDSIAPTFEFGLSQIGIDAFRLGFGGLMTFAARDVTWNIEPEDNEPIIAMGELALHFPQLQGLGGRVQNLNILQSGLPDLTAPDLTVIVDFSDEQGNNFFQDKFDFLPVRVDSVGLKFHGQPFDDTNGDGIRDPGEVWIDDPEDPDGRLNEGIFEINTDGDPIGFGDPRAFSVIFTGGLVETSNGDGGIAFPITAEFQDLELDIQKLADGEFPIANLGGVFIGIQPFDLVPGSSFKVGGGIGFGSVEGDDGDPVYFIRLQGDFQYNNMGAGLELVISEYGPVLGRISAPLGIVLGQTSLMISGVEGGIVFGGPAFPTVSQPEELLTNPLFLNPLELTQTQITESVRQAVANGEFTWERSITLALSGTLTTVAAPGIITANGLIAVNVDFQPDPPDAEPRNELRQLLEGTPDLRLFGSVDVKMFGFPLGDAGLLLDFSEPLAPQLNFAFAAPPPSNPLAFLFPAQAVFTVALDTTGLIEAPLVGMYTFTKQVLAEGGQVVLERIAAELDQNRHRPLAQLLLDTNDDRDVSTRPEGDSSSTFYEDDQDITAEFILSRLIGFEDNNANGRFDDGDTVSLDLAGASPNRVPGMLPASLTDIENLSERDLARTVNLAVALTNEFFLLGIDFNGYIAALFTRDDPNSTPARRSAAAAQVAQLELEAAELVREFSAILTGAALNAIQAGWATFDPTLKIRGAIQPTFFGFPMGPPEAAVELIVSKDFVSFGLTASIINILKELSPMLGGIAGRLFIEAVTGGFNDRITIQAGLALPATLIESFITGLSPEQLGDPQSLIGELNATGLTQELLDLINPFTSPWEVLVNGDLEYQGFKVARLNGFMFRPGSDLVDISKPGITKIQLMDLNGDDVHDNLDDDPDNDIHDISTDLIQISRRSDYEHMLEFGGMLMTGQVLMPRILSDPVGLLNGINWEIPEVVLEVAEDPTSFENLPKIPEAVDELTNYIQRLINALTSEDEYGRIQFFVPALDTLFQLNHLTENYSESPPSEPYVDTNNNGIFDVEDGFADLNNNLLLDGEPFLDLNGDGELTGEPFIDWNRNKQWNAPEPFDDLDGDGMFSGGEPYLDIGNRLLDGEPFQDLNGNGVRDQNEPFDDRGNGEYDTGESYEDLNGNGKFDTAEPFVDLGDGMHNGGETYVDLNGNGRYDAPEPFEDLDLNLARNGDEPFRDLNGNGAFDRGEPFFDRGDGKFNAGGGTPRVQFRQPEELTGVLGDKISRMLDSIFLDGFLQLKLLSVDLGEGTLRADSGGLKATAFNPFLAGLRTEFGIRHRNVNAGEMLMELFDSPLLDTALAGQAPDLNALAAALAVDLSEINASLPVASFSADFGSENVRQFLDSQGVEPDSFVGQLLQDKLGLPPELFQFPDDPFGNLAANTRFAGFSPGFDPESDDVIQQRGGFRLTTNLNLPPLIENARFEFEAPLFIPDLDGGNLSSFVIPDFTARGSFEDFAVGLPATPQLLALTGLEPGEDFVAELVKDGDSLSLALSGKLIVLPATTTGGKPALELVADGFLQVDARTNDGNGTGVFGDIRLSSDASGLGNLGASWGLALDGELSLQINTSGELRTFTRDPDGPNARTFTLEPGPYARIHIDGVQAGESAVLTVLNQIQLEGAFDLSIANGAFALSGDAVVPLGSLGALGGHLALNGDRTGIFGAFQLGGGAPETLSGTGYVLSGRFGLEINTTGATRTIANGRLDINPSTGSPIKISGQDKHVSVTIPKSTARLFVGGRLEASALFKVHGGMELTLSPSQIGVRMLNTRFQMLGIELALPGTAQAILHTGPNPGLFLEASLSRPDGNPVSLPFGAASVSGDLALRLDTRLINPPAVPLQVRVSDAQVAIPGFELRGSLSVGEQNNLFHVSVPDSDPLTLNMWGRTLSFSGSLSGNGSFNFQAEDTLSLGEPSTLQVTGNALVTLSNTGDNIFSAEFSGAIVLANQTIFNASTGASITRNGFIHVEVDGVGELCINITLPFSQFIAQNPFDTTGCTLADTTHNAVWASAPLTTIQETNLDQILQVTFSSLRKNSDLEVQYVLQEGTARLPEDFSIDPAFYETASNGTAYVGTFNFGASTTRILPITIKGDQRGGEGNHTFTLFIEIEGDPKEPTDLLTSAITFTIIDDDLERPVGDLVYFTFDTLEATSTDEPVQNFCDACLNIHLPQDAASREARRLRVGVDAALTINPTYNPPSFETGPFGWYAAAGGWPVSSSGTSNITDDAPDPADPADGFVKADQVAPQPDVDTGARSAITQTVIINPTGFEKFFEFRVDAGDERLLDLSEIRFLDARTAGGPATWEVRTSLDNYASVLASGVTHTQITPGAPNVVSLDSSAFDWNQIAGEVGFRIYGRNATSGNATWGIEGLALIGVSRAQPTPPGQLDPQELLRWIFELEEGILIRDPIGRDPGTIDPIEHLGNPVELFNRLDSRVTDVTETVERIAGARGSALVSNDWTRYERVRDPKTGQTIDRPVDGYQKYFEFSVAPANDRALNLTQIVFSEQRDKDGPQTWELYSSLDKFAEPVATGKTHTEFSNSVASLPAATFGKVTESVTFRLVGGDARSQSGTWALDDISVVGESDSRP